MSKKNSEPLDEDQVRSEIVFLCQVLHTQGCLAAADGNVSYRLNNDRILITPTGRNKFYLKPEEIAVVRLDGEVIEGQPSSEKIMHLSVYKKCDAALCVVHAHPPTAIAWTIAKPTLERLPSESISEVILAAGQIPVVPYARPGTIAMGEALIPYLPTYRVLILARHGALSWGESLEEAYNGIERLEHSAKILKSAVELGGITSLPEEEVKALWKIREQLGNRNL